PDQGNDSLSHLKLCVLDLVHLDREFGVVIKKEVDRALRFFRCHKAPPKFWRQPTKPSNRSLPKTDSGTNCSRLRFAFDFQHFSGKGRYDLEQVAYDPVVGNVEDRRLWVFVDRDDCLRVFHTDDVLDRARYTDREVELGRDGLTGAPNLAVHRQPLVVADRPRRSDFRAERTGQLLHDLDVFLALDSASDSDDQRSLSKINRLFCLLELFFRLRLKLCVSEVDAERGDGTRRVAGFGLVRAIRASLKRSKHRRRAGGSDIGVELALKDLSRKHDVASVN